MKIIERADAIVIQGNEDFSSPFIAGEPIPILSEVLRQHLDGNLTAQLSIPDTIHLSHAAGAEMANDFELPELCPRRKHHTLPHAEA